MVKAAVLSKHWVVRATKGLTRRPIIFSSTGQRAAALALALFVVMVLGACSGQQSSPTPTPNKPVAPSPAAPSSGSGNSTAIPASVEPMKLPTSSPLATPQDVPIGRPTSEDEYKKLKEQAQNTVLPTPASVTPDHG